MGFHVNLNNEVKPCGADWGNPRSSGCKFNLSKEQHFDTEQQAQNFVEKKERENPDNSFFPDMYSRQTKKERKRRYQEPPNVPEYESAKKYLEESGSDESILQYHGKTPEESRDLEERTPTLSFSDNPNMRLKGDPDARYVAAQKRSREMSSSDTKGKDNVFTDMQTFVSGDKKYKIRVNSEGHLHDYNYPAYDDGEVEMFFESGVLHRDPEDGPAIRFKNGGGSIYVYHGLYHNPKGPAVITPERVEHYMHGLLHKLGGPAVVHRNGTQEIWEKGEYKKTIHPPVNEPPEALK